MRLETRPWSTWTSSSTQVAPALRRSVCRLGHEVSVFRSGWPAYDEDVATADEVEVVVQVNGKVRSRITLPRGADEQTARARAVSDPRLEAFLEGKDVRKVIVVPNRIVNIVVG